MRAPSSRSRTTGEVREPSKIPIKDEKEAPKMSGMTPEDIRAITAELKVLGEQAAETPEGADNASPALVATMAATAVIFAAGIKTRDFLERCRSV